MIKITVYAGTSDKGVQNASTVVHGPMSEREVTETLRKIGLEWKTADYFPQRTVVITLEPVENPPEDPPDKDSVVEALRNIRVLLEGLIR